jgi:xanthine dehydrogenase accessory factor
VYEIAMTVAACLKSGTRADVGWLVGSDGLSVSDWSDAVVFTPGGGQTGSLLDGALDAKLGDLAGRWGTGRLVDIELTQVDVLIAELPSPGAATCLLVPADGLPAELWPLAAARERFCLVVDMQGGEVTETAVYSAGDITEAGPDVEELFAEGSPGSLVIDDRIVSVFVALPRMVIVGSTPVAESLAELAPFLGWQPRLATESSLATGLIAPLSTIDMVVVAAHDLELAGAALAAALESGCGYIGSLGSHKMQADRADWLAYRGITDLTRVHGPAGLDIGAGTPEQIAVAIAAEAIAATGRDG